jgi:hypothetical protein
MPVYEGKAAGGGGLIVTRNCREAIPGAVNCQRQVTARRVAANSPPG